MRSTLWLLPALLRGSIRDLAIAPHAAAESRWGPAARLAPVVLFFEIMLVAAVVVITWFALYALYRLITDES